MPSVQLQYVINQSVIWCQELPHINALLVLLVWVHTLQYYKKKTSYLDNLY